jgi:hypothetical protein
MCSTANTCVLFKKWPPAVPIHARHFGAQITHLAQGRPLHELKPEELRPFVQGLSLAASFLFKEDGTAHGESILDQFRVRDDPIPVADHLPLVDDDKDRFSTIGTLRGFHWRGKDCDDTKADVYPGRAETSYGPAVDHVRLHYTALHCTALHCTATACRLKFCVHTIEL